ncbi:MAG: squalene--hopene cyclase, partial [Armatimonadota bacterium]
VLEMAAGGSFGAALDGAVWLNGLQNADAGWPTFCRGWGRLPFDRSSPDVTAHAVRATRAVLDMPDADAGDRGYLERLLVKSMDASIGRGFGYLAAAQRDDGSWVPLWFGDQRVVSEANPVLGTARVLAAFGDCDRMDDPHAEAGVKYLLRAQNDDGGWGGAVEVASTIEQTALAVSALCRFTGDEDVNLSVEGGVEYLLDRVDDGTWTEPEPIGLYFASLWYTEALYPITWTIEALGRAREALSVGDSGGDADDDDEAQSVS